MNTANDSPLMLKKIDRLASDCFRYELEDRNILVGKSVTTLTTYYNGIGPDFTPDYLLNVIDCMKEDFEPAALIHDLQCALEKNRSFDNFVRVNAVFFTNCVKIAKIKYGIFSPKRYGLINSAKRLVKECNGNGGWESWCKERKNT